MVLDRIRETKFKLNLGKCTFAAREVAYLGHLVSPNGVSPDVSKVKTIKSFPLPRSVGDVRAFLGLGRYYRSFIQNFAALSKPLTLLTLCSRATTKVAFSVTRFSARRDFRRFLARRLVNAFVSKCNLVITPRLLPTDAGCLCLQSHTNNLLLTPCS